jgi:hypothetical protein
MGWQHIQGDCIAVRQEKTNTPLLIPIDEPLAAVLGVLRRKNMTFLVTGFGKPFTAPGFGNWFRERCDEACASWRRRDWRMPDAAIRRSRRSLDIDRIRRWPLTSVPPIRRASRVLRWSEEPEQNGTKIYPTAKPTFTQQQKSADFSKT